MNLLESMKDLPPDQQLWLAVIAGAVDDALRPEESGATTAERLAAITWLMAEGSGLASFEWACRQIGLEPEAVRRHVRQSLIWMPPS